MTRALVAPRFGDHRCSARGHRAFKRCHASGGVVQRGVQYPRRPASRWAVHVAALIRLRRRARTSQLASRIAVQRGGEYRVFSALLPAPRNWRSIACSLLAHCRPTRCSTGRAPVGFASFRAPVSSNVGRHDETPRVEEGRRRDRGRRADGRMMSFAEQHALLSCADEGQRDAAVDPG